MNTNCGTWVLMLALLPNVAAAQLIEPGPEHYAAAYDSLAVVKATDRLRALDAADREVAKLMRKIRAALAEGERRDRAILNAWATEVRRRNGVLGANPGTGWHEVHRHGD